MDFAIVADFLNKFAEGLHHLMTDIDQGWSDNRKWSDSGSHFGIISWLNGAESANETSNAS